jgi:SAM-dependent methyltransferase
MNLGDALRGAGLTPRALAAWAGTDRLSALPPRLAALAAREVVPASTALALFVAGASVPRAQIRLPLDALAARGLVELDARTARATVAILPLARSLVVCDRDTWPDDSSYHLASAIPAGRRARWLDLGCGSAFAPLAHPELADAITGIDLDPHSIDHARLGAELSGVAIALHTGDLATATGSFDLITCNAPIPDDPSGHPWRHADAGFFDRLWPAARACAARGALIVVHGALAALDRELPGELVVVGYTPDRVPGFGVAWWRPDAPARRIVARRLLTAEQPHLDASDYDRAVA